MSGLFGSSGLQTLPTFDFSVLGDYYVAQTQLHTARLTATTGSRPSDTVTSNAPWDKKPGDTSAISRLKDALTAGSFIDIRDSDFESAGVDSEQRKLFAMYKALSRLQSLASHASADSTTSGELLGLNRRVQAGLNEVKSYLADTTFDALTLQFGKRQSKAESALSVARPPTQYTGPKLVTGAAANVIPGLTGTEVFTISIAKSTSTTDVAIDLSQISGDLSVTNVIDYINSQLQAGGFYTRFTTTIFDGKKATDAKSYGIGIQTTVSERVTFSAAATSPAVYVAGVAGSGTEQTGQLLKLTDQGTSVATNFNTKIAPTSGTADVRATTTDSSGNVYVVGSVTGDMGSGILQGDQDVYLRKYDAAGQLIWSRLLGSSERASGYAVATDANGNVAIAGKVTDNLTSTAVGGGDDTFVTKYDSTGREIFTRQIAPIFDDQANALTFGADGSLYVAGQTKSSMASGITHGGGSDAYLMKLTSTGSLEYVRQFGGSGDDRATTVAVDDNGDVVLGTVEAGEAKVRKLLSTDGTSDPVWELSLGALGQGQLSSIAIDGNAVYVAGATSNAALTAGGQASVVTAHSGGEDAFVMRIDDAGATAAAAFVTYVGTARNEGGAGVAVADGAVYLTGSTSGNLNGGANPSQTNGYVVKLDSNGSRVWTYQYESTQGTATARAVTVDSQGGSVLDKLGLPRGTVSFDETRLISSASSVRAGDYFYVKVNNGSAFKVSVSATDTMRSLVTRVNSVLLLKGEAELAYGSGHGMRISANEGNTVELIRGSAGFDALAGLGLEPGKLDNTKDKAPANATKKDLNVFSLELDTAASVGDKVSAQALALQLSNAMATIKSAFQAMTASTAKPNPTVQLASNYYNSIAALGTFG
jgi:hypothetical protein